MRYIKIAAIQIECLTDYEANIEKCKKLISIASENNPDIVCLPELAFYHWFPATIDSKFFSLAITLDSEILNEFKELAKEKNLVLIIPFFEKDIDTEGIFYNSAVVIDKDGIIKGLYRKIHLPLIPNWEEKYYFKPGNLGFPVIETSICKIGIQIGWDVFFPESARILALKGAEIIISPTTSAFSTQVRWLKIITANALMNTSFICRINRVGKQDELEFYGNSFCAAPDGSLISEPAGSSEGIVLWNINLDEIFEVRRLFPFLKDRNEKEYFDIVGKNLEQIIQNQT